ncbi:MAG: WecB/TagA/CpsF family glycosyltransferase [Ilumatobacteraceae bacterium]
MIRNLPTERLFGLDFVTLATIDDVAARLLDASGDRVADWRCVVTPNVDHLVRYQRHPAEAETAATSFVVLPDGMPIVLASRLLGRPLTARLPGSDLFGALWPVLAAESVPVVAVAPNEAVAAELEATYPGARSVIAPMFDVDDEPAVSALLDEIEAAVGEHRARVLVIGVSMPKHHLIASRLRQRWAGEYCDKPIVMLLGASPELALGLTRRAPKWMQRAGLEWLHRLLLDPRRMAKRYLVDDVAFIPLVWREWRQRGRRPPQHR